MILAGQRHAVILRMALDKNLPAVPAHHNTYACLLGLRQNLQLRVLQDVLPVHFRVAGMGAVEVVVKAAHQRHLVVQHLVHVDAGQLRGPDVLRNAVMIIQSHLGAPADMEGGSDVGLRPLHDLAELLPVIHLLIIQEFHRRAGDNHSVIFMHLHIAEGNIELVQMRCGGVLGNMGRKHQERTVHLQRGVGQGPEQLRLRLFLHRHQVEDENLQRTDLLTQSSRLTHNEYILVFQYLLRRQIVLNLNRHTITFLSLQKLHLGYLSTTPGQMLPPPKEAFSACPRRLHGIISPRPAILRETRLLSQSALPAPWLFCFCRWWR